MKSNNWIKPDLYVVEDALPLSFETTQTYQDLKRVNNDMWSTQSKKYYQYQNVLNSIWESTGVTAPEWMSANPFSKWDKDNIAEFLEQNKKLADDHDTGYLALIKKNLLAVLKRDQSRFRAGSFSKIYKTLLENPEDGIVNQNTVFNLINDCKDTEVTPDFQEIQGIKRLQKLSELMYTHTHQILNKDQRYRRNVRVNLETEINIALSGPDDSGTSEKINVRENGPEL